MQDPRDDRFADAAQQVEAEQQIASEQLRRTLAALDRRAMEREPGEAPDTRTVAERKRDLAMVNDAMAAARRVVSPTAAEQYLDTLAFVVGVLMQRTFQQQGEFATEEAQYVALYQARRDRLGRALWPHERAQLREASRAIWAQVHSGTLPSDATWTARSVA